MLTSYLAMQNAVLANNMAVSGINQASAGMLSTVSFGSSQPLRPSFTAQSYNNELQMKANETKVSVLKKLIDSIKAKLGKDIERSTPKYAGLDYKA